MNQFFVFLPIHSFKYLSLFINDEISTYSHTAIVISNADLIYKRINLYKKDSYKKKIRISHLFQIIKSIQKQ